MIRYRASWVLPVSTPPLRDGWVDLDRGRVAALGRGGPESARPEVDLGHVAVLPGLVNAHTHLELSYLQGQIAPSPEFVSWIKRVVSARRERNDPRSPEIVTAVDRALAEAARCGTAVIGDISNTLVSVDRLSASSLAAVVFYELIRFNAPDPEALVATAVEALEKLATTERVRASLAAHAPYSVAPAVFQAIQRAAARLAGAPWSVHLSESPEEVDFIRSGGGVWRAFLDDMGAWDPAWTAPGCSPVEYLDRRSLLDARLLAVHGVQMSASDLERLMRRGATLVTCPRSNQHTGAGAPPVERFFASRVRVAVGTDSLASAPDLNVFSELAALRAIAPAVPAASLIESATRSGAEALGFGADYGTIEPGKSARLIVVSLPASTGDVEEYLVSGIQPGQVRWLDA